MKYPNPSPRKPKSGFFRSLWPAVIASSIVVTVPLTARAQDGNPDTEIFSRPGGTESLFDLSPSTRLESSHGFHLAPDQDPDELVPIAFLNAPMGEILVRLEELAGKPVKPSPTLITDSEVLSLINSREMRREDALNLLVSMLYEEGKPVIDRGSYLFVGGDLSQDHLKGSVPFIPAGEDILDRTDIGWIAEKAFAIKYGKAENIKAVIETSLPGSYKIGVDEASNQLHIIDSIGTLQRIQVEINSLDVADTLEVETFFLEYADANNVAELIVGLYSAEDESSSGGGRQGQNLFRPSRGRQPEGSEISQTERLKVVVDKTHNSVSVLAERPVLDQIREQVANVWDMPVPPAKFEPRVYDLKNRDAVQLRDLLRDIFAPESGGEVGVFQADNRAGTFRSAQSRRSGLSGDGEQAQLNPLRGQVEIHADEEKNRLIVMTRSEQYYEAIDAMIRDLDADKDPNLPKLVLLKYADSEDLANRLNAIFADGGNVSIQMQQQDLQQRGTGSIVNDSTGGDSGGSQEETQELPTPWLDTQREPDELPLSAIIGKVRIMPYPRQNGLLVLARPDQMGRLTALIEQLDQPGRQVLIEAIVAEVSHDDGLSLGVRWGTSGVLDGPNPDNRIDAVARFDNTKENLIDALFDTSVLDVDFNLNAALQALQEKNDVRILDRPRLFTSDNEEAYLFDGRDVPFITDSQSTDQGGITQTFDYLAVGIRLAVRPHITVEGSIDLRVNLELSSVVPGETLFGGSILDRRETETKVTIRDGETVVISGILREQETDLIRKVPLIGDIPLIGLLFRSTEKARSQTELVAFIRPVVLDNPTEIRDTADWHRRQLGDLGDEIDLNDPGYFNMPVDPDEEEMNGSAAEINSDADRRRKKSGAFWWQDDSR